jgi:ketosteroid isomerase-like protein
VTGAPGARGADAAPARRPAPLTREEVERAAAALVAAFVRTTTETGGVAETTAERETIVFHRTADGSVSALHEHLSPVPPTPEARS